MPPGAKQELSYTQFWTLAGEGRVDKVTFYGPEKRSMLALLSASAPGGARTIKVRSGGIAGYMHYHIQISVYRPTSLATNIPIRTSPFVPYQIYLLCHCPPLSHRSPVTMPLATPNAPPSLRSPCRRTQCCWTICRSTVSRSTPAQTTRATDCTAPSLSRSGGSGGLG